MKFLFIIQGEGRGHMTQAVALHEILTNAGHEVIKVFLGTSPRRKVPEFIKRQFTGKTGYFRSPNFSPRSDNKGIRTGTSILKNLWLSPLYVRESFRMAGIIRKSEADVVINFYDLIGGLANFLSFSHKKYFVLSHHLYFGHPSFVFPEGHLLMKWLLRLHTRICSINAHRRLALSFTRQEQLPGSRLLVVPPLLRRKVFNLVPEQNGRLLVYFLNEGYLDELREWSKRNPYRKIEVFTATSDHAVSPGENIRYRPLGGDDFLVRMSNAGGIITTAGFETVCEAFYLGKRILVIPSADHFEQLCNAHDAARSGIAAMDEKADPGSLPALPAEELLSEFREWCKSASEAYVDILCS